MNMTCIQVTEIGGFHIREVAVKEPAADEALIRVAVTGLCRTDLKLIRVGHRDLTLPRIPGEEVAGAIVKTGKNAAPFTEGDRVYVYPGLWCGTCPSCRAGAENLCRGMQIMGFHRDGGFAEYVVAPVKSLIRIPNGLEFEDAVFAEPLSCCLNALELAAVKKGESVGIWGAGPAGTLLARAAKALGAEPFNIEPDAARREKIDGYAAPDRSFDACIVAVGAREAYQEALASLNPRGRLTVFSGLPPDDDRFDISFNQLHYHEQTLVGAYGCAYRHGEKALERIAGGAVPVRDLISHRMSLADLDAALTIVERKTGMKVLLYPSRP